MSELKPLFELEGRPVMRGQELHIAPSYHWRAGAKAKVERFHNDEEVQLRSGNGAVPTVPVRALSWSAHPDTVAMEQMADAGLGRASQRDLAVWKAARAQPAQAGQVLTDDQWQRIADITQTILTRDTQDEIEAVLAKRVPMTELQAKDIADSETWGPEAIAMEAALIRVVRATERHHGIVGEKGGA